MQIEMATTNNTFYGTMAQSRIIDMSDSPQSIDKSITEETSSARHRSNTMSYHSFITTHKAKSSANLPCQAQKNPFAIGGLPIGGRTFMENVVGVKKFHKQKNEFASGLKWRVYEIRKGLHYFFGAKRPVEHAFTILVAIAIICLVLNGCLMFESAEECALRYNQQGNGCCQCVQFSPNVLAAVAPNGSFYRYEEPLDFLQNLSLEEEQRVNSFLHPTQNTLNRPLYGVIVIIFSLACSYLLILALLEENAYLTVFVLGDLTIAVIVSGVILLEKFTDETHPLQGVQLRWINFFTDHSTGLVVARQIVLIISLSCFIAALALVYPVIQKYGLIGVRRYGVISGLQQAYRAYQIHRTLVYMDHSSMFVFYTIMIVLVLPSWWMAYCLAMVLLLDVSFHMLLYNFVPTENKRGTDLALFSSLFVLVSVTVVLSYHFYCTLDAFNEMLPLANVFEEKDRLLFPTIQSVASYFAELQEDCLVAHTVFDSRTIFLLWMEFGLFCIRRVCMWISIVYLKWEYYGSGCLKSLFYFTPKDTTDAAAELVEDIAELNGSCCDIGGVMEPLLPVCSSSTGLARSSTSVAPADAAPKW